MAHSGRSMSAAAESVFTQPRPTPDSDGFGQAAHGLLTDPRQFDILQTGSGRGDRMQFDQLNRREFLSALGVTPLV
jgi:hypothetical protein